MGDPDLTAEQVGAIQAVFDATGAVDAVETSITALVDEALLGLAACDLTAEAQTSSRRSPAS